VMVEPGAIEPLPFALRIQSSLPEVFIFNWLAHPALR
jgi:hypothetical protein